MLGRLQVAGLTLNEKCEFNKTSIRFLGHIIDSSGVHADGQKLEAIQRFPDPTNTTELIRLTGMANQLGKFVPNLAQLSAPMCYLLKADVHWQWGGAQAESFERVKQALTSPTALARYEPRRYTVVAADASGYGIGAVCMQVQDNGERKPVCFDSRALTDVEKQYAVIEKEALAATWACDNFADYIVVMPFLLESDHKPLVPLLSSTELAKMPPRIQRFRMRMMRYNPEVQYVQGRLHVSADALSRAPVGRPSTEDNQLVHEVNAFADMSRNAIPTSAVKLLQITTAQKEDDVCTEVRRYCHEGWSAFMLYDERIVTPRCMRLETLKAIHVGHLVISKCRSRANTAVWWPGLSKEIEERVSTCHTCAKVRPEPKETMMAASFPSRPWERVGIDLFELNGKVNIVIVDYYSRWVEFRKLTMQSYF